MLRLFTGERRVMNIAHRKLISSATPTAYQTAAPFVATEISTMHSGVRMKPRRTFTAADSRVRLVEYRYEERIVFIDANRNAQP